MEENTFIVFIEKTPHVSEPTQFKPVVFKGQLYFKHYQNTKLQILILKPHQFKESRESENVPKSIGNTL